VTGDRRPGPVLASTPRDVERPHVVASYSGASWAESVLTDDRPGLPAALAATNASIPAEVDADTVDRPSRKKLPYGDDYGDDDAGYV
jgi:hypothetical protein